MVRLWLGLELTLTLTLTIQLNCGGEGTTTERHQLSAESSGPRFYETAKLFRGEFLSQKNRSASRHADGALIRDDNNSCRQRRPRLTHDYLRNPGSEKITKLMWPEHVTRDACSRSRRRSQSCIDRRTYNTSRAAPCDAVSYYRTASAALSPALSSSFKLFPPHSRQPVVYKYTL